MAIEAPRGELALVKLAANHGVRHIMIAAWMRQAIDGLAVGSTVRPIALRLLARRGWISCTPRSGSWRCSRFLAKAFGRLALNLGARLPSRHTTRCRSRPSAACCRSAVRPSPREADTTQEWRQFRGARQYRPLPMETATPPRLPSGSASLCLLPAAAPNTTLN